MLLYHYEPITHFHFISSCLHTFIFVTLSRYWILVNFINYVSKQSQQRQLWSILSSLPASVFQSLVAGLKLTVCLGYGNTAHITTQQLNQLYADINAAALL